MATSQPSPTLTTLPRELILDIFCACPSARSAQALAESHPTLHKIYKTYDVQIHTTLANRLLGPLAVQLIQSGHPDKMSAKTQKFLAICATGIIHGPLLERVLRVTKGDPLQTRLEFPFFWKRSLGLWRPIGKEIYLRMCFEIRISLWQLFKGLFPLEEKQWDEGLQQYVKDRAQLEASRASSGISCQTCVRKGAMCFWHGEQASQEEDWFFEYSVYCNLDGLKKRPFSTPVLWETFLRYILFFIGSVYPMPTNIPPEFENFSCTADSCQICTKEFQILPGGDHVWDYSVTENLTETQIKALGYLEGQFSDDDDSDELYSTPFQFPYQMASFQSFTPYWEGLTDFAKPDPTTGKLVPLEDAKRRFFSGERECHRFRVYDQRVIDVETPDGGKTKKTIVEDRMVWEHLVWEREEIVRRHKGLPRRNRLDFLSGGPGGMEEGDVMDAFMAAMMGLQGGL